MPSSSFFTAGTSVKGQESNITILTRLNCAHGLADLRSPARGGIGKPPQPPRPPMNGGVGPMVGGMPGSTIQNGKFKTVMCEKITSQVTI